MFVHSLTVERRTWDDSEEARDDYGQPVPTTSTTTVMGLVQPRSVREAVAAHQAGAEVGDHVIFLPISLDIVASDTVIYDGDRYEVKGVRRFEFGSLAHLEVDAMLVTAPARMAEGGGS